MSDTINIRDRFANAWEPKARAALLLLHLDGVRPCDMPARLVALGYRLRTKDACKNAITRALSPKPWIPRPKRPNELEVQRLALNRPWH